MPEKSLQYRPQASRRSYLRHAIEPASSDRRIVIIEDDKIRRSGIAHRLRDYSVRCVMAAVFPALFFALTPEAAQSGTINTNMIGGQSVGRTELEGPYAKAAFQVEAGAGQNSTSEDAPRAQQGAVTAAAVDQQFHNDDRVQALALELAEARSTIEGLEAQLRAEAAKSALLVEQERQKSAALARDAAAARQELTTATAKHRQALAEEREGRASLLATAAAKHRQELNEEREHRSKLVSEIAAERREIEAQATKFRTVSEETGQLKDVEAAKNELECGKMAALLREAAAARHELTTGAETQRQALDEERALSSALASELAKAQQEIETQATQARKANREAGQLKQARSVTSAQPPDPGARENAHSGTGGSSRATRAGREYGAASSSAGREPTAH
jgi:hypothetical protein